MVTCLNNPPGKKVERHALEIRPPVALLLFRDGALRDLRLLRQLPAEVLVSCSYLRPPPGVCVKRGAGDEILADSPVEKLLAACVGGLQQHRARRATQTARALLGAGAVPSPRSVPPGIWARNFLVARRAKDDGPLDRGEAEDHEDVKAAPSQTTETVEDAKKGITGKKASSAKYEDEVEEVEEATTEAKAGFDQDEWLQKTAEQIKNFTVEQAIGNVSCLSFESALQVCDWAKAVLKAKGLDEGLAAEAAQRLENEAVTGEVLIGVTAQELKLDVGMKRGPATLLEIPRLQSTALPQHFLLLDTCCIVADVIRLGSFMKRMGEPSHAFLALHGIGFGTAKRSSDVADELTNFGAYGPKYTIRKPAGSSAASWVEDALKSKFDDDMQNGNICMLQNWDTYKSTLPVREVDNTALPLFELLYFGKEADVQTLGSLLANVPGTTSRLVAPYLTAPGAYGKTSSVSPAFLTNGDFGLYLYMSFYNNAEQRHEGPSVGMVEKMHSQMTDPDLAGVAFMWDCLKTQLKKGKYVRTSPRPEWFTSITDGTAVHIDKDKLRAQIKNLLDEIRPQRKLVLIHLDEHKKMWEGEDARAIQFRRAALQALLSIDFVRVILTFTEPPSLPPDDFRNTSALARVALPFARAAADKVALHFCPDILSMYGKPADWTASEQRVWACCLLWVSLCIDAESPTALSMYGKPADWTASEQRVWACCLLWVSLCIDAESPTALHRQDSQLRKGFSSLTTWLQNGAKKQKSQFLAKFGETFEAVLTWDKGQNPLDTKMVRQLVAGMKDADAPQKEAMPTLVSVSGQRLCLPLFRLLYVQPLNQTEQSSCFWRSRDVFLEDMRKAPAKVLVGSPLERAVLCALTCRDSLRLPNGSSIMLSFEQLEAGRLFKKVSATGSELQLARALQSLTRHTLYYDGLEGKEGHPLADIWFCAAPKRLVLLDCGGTKKKASKKMSAKKRQISQLVANGCFSGWKVTVLLFIPAAPSETKTSSTSLSDDVDIAIVAGSLATEWLGSWSQLWQYLPDDG
eukprot:s1056_g10.t1